MRTFTAAILFILLFIAAVSAKADTLYGEKSFSGHGNLVIGHNIAARKLTFAPGKHSLELHINEKEDMVACILLNQDGGRMAEGSKRANKSDPLFIYFNVRSRSTYTLFCEARIQTILLPAAAMSFTYVALIDSIRES